MVNDLVSSSDSDSDLEYQEGGAIDKSDLTTSSDDSDDEKSVKSGEDEDEDEELVENSDDEEEESIEYVEEDEDEDDKIITTIDNLPQRGSPGNSEPEDLTYPDDDDDDDESIDGIEKTENPDYEGVLLNPYQEGDRETSSHENSELDSDDDPNYGGNNNELKILLSSFFIDYKSRKNITEVLQDISNKLSQLLKKS